MIGWQVQLYLEANTDRRGHGRKRNTREGGACSIFERERREFHRIQLEDFLKRSPVLQQ